MCIESIEYPAILGIGSFGIALNAALKQIGPLEPLKFLSIHAHK